MFKNLTNFGYKRNAKEAFGFYIAYFILALIFGAVVGGVLGVVFYTLGIPQKESITLIQKIVLPLAIIVISSISVLIVHAKKLYKNCRAIILVLLSILFSAFLGALLGVIPAAILSVFSNTREQEATANQTPPVE